MSNNRDIFVIRLHSAEDSIASHLPSGSNLGGTIFSITSPMRLESSSNETIRSTWDVQSIWMSAGIQSHRFTDINAMGTFLTELRDWLFDCQLAWTVCSHLPISWSTFLNCRIAPSTPQNVVHFYQFENLESLADNLFKPTHNFNLGLSLTHSLVTRTYSEAFQAVLETYANAFTSEHLPVQFIYLFAAVEGVVHNWAVYHHKRFLLDQAYLSAGEEHLTKEIQNGLRKSADDFIANQRNLTDAQRAHVSTIIENQLPLLKKRKIFRSLKHIFEDYVDAKFHNLTCAKRIKHSFRRLKELRNIFAHSNIPNFKPSDYLRSINEMTDLATVILQTELADIRNTPVSRDWRFKERTLNLAEFFSPLQQQADHVPLQLIQQQHTISRDEGGVIAHPLQVDNVNIEWDSLNWSCGYNRDQSPSYDTLAEFQVRGERALRQHPIITSLPDQRGRCVPFTEHQVQYRRQIGGEGRQQLGALRLGGEMNSNYENRPVTNSNLLRISYDKIYRATIIEGLLTNSNTQNQDLQFIL